MRNTLIQGKAAVVAKLRELVNREAPEGFEDEAGFHFAEKGSANAGAPRQARGPKYRNFRPPFQEAAS